MLTAPVRIQGVFESGQAARAKSASTGYLADNYFGHLTDPEKTGVVRGKTSYQKNLSQRSLRFLRSGSSHPIILTILVTSSSETYLRFTTIDPSSSRCFPMVRSKSFKPSEYKMEAGRLQAVLGPLESDVMEVAWRFEDNSFTVRQVLEELKKNRKIAYTTIMTTMDSLNTKGLLSRTVKKGRGGLLYEYRTSTGRKDLETQTVRDVLRSLWKTFGKEVVTSHFVDEMGMDPEELEKLARKERKYSGKEIEKE